MKGGENHLELTINTSIPVSFELMSDDDPRFARVKIWMCHTGKNRKNTFFDKKVIESAIPSLSNIPILGFIEVDNYNQADFQGHEERIIIKDNDISVTYVGRAYGLIPSENNARFETKLCEDNVEREFLVVDALLWSRFKESIEIFDRDDGVKKHSMELEPSTVQGFFDKDKVFNFTSFLFDGACIIGNSKRTGMISSVIEKYTTDSIQTQFQEMLEEFNSQYRQNENINFSLEGGEGVESKEGEKKGGKNLETLEQKNELFSKYTTLSEDDVAEIKQDIEKYSLVEIEAKLKELSDAKFALTYNQVKTEIRKNLKERTIEVEYYGYKYIEQEFYFEDIKDNLVICRHNNWVDYYGIPFSQSGDEVTLDYEAKVAYMADWRPRVEGESTNFSVEDVEIKMNAFAESVKSQFNIKETEEYKALESQFAEITNQHNQITQNFTSLQEEYESLKKVSSEFEEYKFTKEKEEKMELINSNQFSILTEDEKKVFVDEIEKYTLSDLENQLFLALGRKAAQFTVVSSPDKKDLMFTFDNQHEPKVNEKPYAHIVREKSKK